MIAACVGSTTIRLSRGTGRIGLEMDDPLRAAGHLMPLVSVGYLNGRSHLHDQAAVEAMVRAGVQNSVTPSNSRRESALFHPAVYSSGLYKIFVGPPAIRSRCKPRYAALKSYRSRNS